MDAPGRNSTGLCACLPFMSTEVPQYYSREHTKVGRKRHYHTTETAMTCIHSATSLIGLPKKRPNVAAIPIIGDGPDSLRILRRKSERGGGVLSGQCSPALKGRSGDAEALGALTDRYAPDGFELLERH
jgi:hypothetical protein